MHRKSAGGLTLALALSLYVAGATPGAFGLRAHRQITNPAANADPTKVKLKLLHKFSARRGRFSNDGSKMLLQEGNREEVVLVPSGKRVCQIKLSPGYRVSRDTFSPDGRLAAGVSTDYGTGLANLQVLVWDAQTGEQLGGPLAKGPWYEAALSKSLSFAGDSRELSISLDQGPVLMNAETGREGKTLELSPVSPGMILLNSYFSPDGGFIVREIADSLDTHKRHRHEVSVWEAATGKEYKLTIPSLLGVCRFSPNMKFAAISGRVSKSFSIEVVEVETGKILRSFSSDELVGYEDGAAISPDGKLLAVGSSKFFAIFSVASGQRVLKTQMVPTPFSLFWEPTEINDRVDELNFSPNGRYLETAAEAGPVKLWEIQQD